MRSACRCCQPDCTASSVTSSRSTVPVMDEPPVSPAYVIGLRVQVVTRACRRVVINVCPICHMGNPCNSIGSPALPDNSHERVEWDIGMNTVLYFSATGTIYETRAYTTADIDQLVEDQGLQCLTS